MDILLSETGARRAGGQGGVEIFVTDDPERFARVGRLFGADLENVALVAL